jgi:hypothetical protein
MENHKAIWITGILGVLGFAVVCVFFHARPPVNMSASLSLNDAVGQVAAEETLKLLHHQGQILLLTEDNSIVLNVALDSQVKSFRESTNQKNGVKIAAIEKIRRDRIAEARNPRIRGLSSGQLMEAVRGHPGIAGLVSFMGWPVLEPQDLNTLKTSGVKCVAVFNSPFGIDFTSLGAQQILDLGIVAREQPVETGGNKPKTARKLFDQFYTLMEPGAVAQAPQ